MIGTRISTATGVTMHSDRTSIPLLGALGVEILSDRLVEFFWTLLPLPRNF